MSITGKYAPLYRWFKDQSNEKSVIDLSFAQIENILGSKLPPSAFRYEAWWRDSSPGTSHVQAISWLEAGWRVQNVDLKSKRTSFTR